MTRWTGDRTTWAGRALAALLAIVLIVALQTANVGAVASGNAGPTLATSMESATTAILPTKQQTVRIEVRRDRPEPADPAHDDTSAAAFAASADPIHATLRDPRPFIRADDRIGTSHDRPQSRAPPVHG